MSTYGSGYYGSGVYGDLEASVHGCVTNAVTVASVTNAATFPAVVGSVTVTVGSC